jgi:oligosaccharide translocation protein RFT1
VARRLTPEEFGVPTVHFYLLSTAILTTREGFRRALMRDSVKDSSLGYVWFVLPIGGFLSVAVPFGVIWSQNISTRNPYGVALLYYSAAAFIELCAEPYYIQAMRMSAFKLRLFAETTSTVLRSVLTYALVSVNQNVVMAFAHSQVRINLFHPGIQSYPIAKQLTRIS